MELMNSEYHYPHTVDRGTRQDWQEGGSLDMRERARRQAREILKPLSRKSFRRKLMTKSGQSSTFIYPPGPCALAG
jgi:trimethylamine:corrinoid methyltransferase-like protein